MGDKLKYLTCPLKITDALKSCLEEVPRRGGYYNWLYLFKGDVRGFWEVKEDLEDYDIVHVNMSPVDQRIVPMIKEKLKGSSTKLVLNNDHVSEVWGTAFNQHPDEYLRVQGMGDMVFGTEPHQVSSMVDGAFTMPHPHWIEFLKHYGKSEVKKGDVGTIFHWWHGDAFTAAHTLHRLKLESDRKLFTKVYAWDPKYDKCVKWSRVFFDDYIHLLKFQDYLKHLSANEFVYEPCPYHTYGRNSVDAAAIGLPMLGSDRPESMKRCFPQMVCDPYDTKQTIRTMKKVLENKGSWLDEQMAYAKKAVEHYSYKNSEIRFRRAMEIAEEGKNVDGHYQWNDNDFEVV